MEKAWFDGKRVIGLLAKGLPPNHHPSELLTVMAPRLVELCFQTAGLWELAMQGRMGLPRQIREVSVFRPSSADELNAASNRLYAVVSPDPAQGTFDAEVLDSEGNCYLRLNGYQTVTLADAIDPVS